MTIVVEATNPEDNNLLMITYTVKNPGKLTAEHRFQVHQYDNLSPLKVGRFIHSFILSADAVAELKRHL